MAAPTSEVAAAGVAAPVCNGKYKGGIKPSAAELAEILKKHAEWLKDADLDNPKFVKDGNGNPKFANDPRRANLCEADLIGADLRGKVLAGAHLERADLRGADLRGAWLFLAHLENALLENTDLKGTYLFLAHLDNADLVGADLPKAHLGFADLTGADLRAADLTGADLTGAQVSKAKLAGVYLTGAIYAPASEPPEPYVAGIKVSQRSARVAMRKSDLSSFGNCSKTPVLATTRGRRPSQSSATSPGINYRVTLRALQRLGAACEL
jgi:uncharacterized protein YjbI with pentapeptide repeats